MVNFGELFTAASIASFSAVGLAFYLLLAIAIWRVFSKAGYSGILAFIPIVNLVILVKIAGYSGWFVLLYLIPVVNLILAAFVAVRVGENFGKGPVFSIFLLWLFPVIGFFIIGLGNSTYREPVTRY
ncbi:DUF5684 domain-containing protein [Leucobacter chinensis]|uniref:DUF5684 domain-containing protein n=1 Tax=Leucobacter chinensis TaxID=2851010 RepID=UPI001C2130A3|nr:DUF5684 domain-containing protein [Leucobacter chinensis]